MTLQSQKSEFTTDPEFGRRSIWSIPPVARYPDWANPYAPFQTPEAYAAAWRAGIKATALTAERISQNTVEAVCDFLDIENGTTVKALAQAVEFSIVHIRRALAELEADGRAYRKRHTKVGPGSYSDLWFAVDEAARRIIEEAGV